MRQRVNTLRRALDAAQQGDVHALHQARVATRRLREMLPVMAEGRRARKLERQARRLTRALGPVRELDVALLTIDELAAAGAAPAATLARLRQAIRDERRTVQTDMRRRVARVDIDRLRRRACTAARKHAAGDARGRMPDPARAAAADARAARRAARLRAAIENAAAIYLPDRLHEVRVAAKKLRYALEVARELRSATRATPATVRMLRETQDRLGRMHDFEVLIARIRALQGSSSAPTLRQSGDLDRLVRHLETECRRLHGQYIAARRRLLAICDHVAAAAIRRRTAAA